MSNASATDTLLQQVMTGVERLIDGDAEHAFDGLSDEEECLALIISGRTLLQFCDANAGKHEGWDMDATTWQQWIAKALRSLLRWMPCSGHGWTPGSMGKQGHEEQPLGCPSGCKCTLDLSSCGLLSGGVRSAWRERTAPSSPADGLGALPASPTVRPGAVAAAVPG
jgi:hypothetical protein